MADADLTRLPLMGPPVPRPRFEEMVSQSPYTTEPWLAAWHSEMVPDESPHWVLDRDHPGAPEFAAPVTRVRHPRLPYIGLNAILGSEVADYSPILVNDAAGGRELLSHLTRGRGPVLTVLGRVVEDSPLLEPAGRPGGARLVRIHEEVFPSLVLGEDGLDQAGLRRLEKRNDVRRRRRRLQERGPVEFLPAQPPAASPGMAEFLDLHDLRWAQKGNASGLFLTPKGRRLVASAAQGWWETGSLRLSFVTVAGEPIAARFGVVCGTTYFGLKSAFHPSWSSFGPGHLITHAVLDDNLNAGIRRIDFMRGAGEHKSAWGADERRVGFWVASRGLHDRAAEFVGRALLWERHRRRRGP